MIPRSPIDRVAQASIAVAVVVTAIKYLAYHTTGSVALFSDAIESIVNVVTAVVAVFAIRLSALPADGNHQYGHHKAEYVSAVIEGALIILAAMLIAHEAWAALHTPRLIGNAALGIAISGFATLINAAWSAYLMNRGKLWRSPALIADGWHLLSDVLTATGVVAGLAFAAATGWSILDPLLAILVAANILWIGWRLLAGSTSELLDEAVKADVAQRIEAVIADNLQGALEVHDVRTRVAGRITFIEFHLVVASDMTVERAHEICDRLEVAIEAAITGAEVLVHVEPAYKAKRKGAIVFG